jgi:hypothetical protein
MAKRADAEWTILVYMAAENNNLRQWAFADLRAMEAVGSGRDVNIVVQLDRGGTRDASLIHVQRDKRNEDPLGRVNMGNPERLSEFLTRALERFPARRYALILWGHTYRFGFGLDSGRDLTLDVVRDVLLKFKKHNHGRPLDLLGFNSCHMGTAETLHQLRGVALYLAASQIGIPVTSWPYTEILEQVTSAAAGAARLGPRELGEIIVREFAEHYRETFPASSVTLTLYDLRCTDDLVRLSTAFARDLLSSVPHAETAFRAATLPWRTDAFVDVGAVCSAFEASSGSAAARDLRRWLAHGKSAVLCHASYRAPGTSGLSVYAPMEMGLGYFRQVRARYRELDFAKETRWPSIIARLCARRFLTASSPRERGPDLLLAKREPQCKFMETLYEWDSAYAREGCAITSARMPRQNFAAKAAS